MNKQTNMRLMREAKKCAKETEAQIKKHGRIVEKFVCVPDPENLLHWYFIIFGLEGPYEGGYYIGKVECPANFPQNAPNIRLLVKSGIFETNNKICMSMTDYHPESWNPAWSVTQVILGLVSFWYQDEYTAGSIYYSNNPEGIAKKKKDRI